MSNPHIMKDPAMEAARIEILAVLKKHDLMGAVVLAGKERSGFFQEYSPSWSCAKMEETAQGQAVRIRAKREEYPTEKDQAEHIRTTINGFMGLMHAHKFIGSTVSGIIALFAEHFDLSSVASDHQMESVEIDPSKN